MITGECVLKSLTFSGIVKSHLNASTIPFKKNLKMVGACTYLYVYVCSNKKDISELIEAPDGENTKRQRKYAVSSMCLKNYDIYRVYKKN